MAGETDFARLLGALEADRDTRQRQSADQYRQLGEIRDICAGIATNFAVLAEKLGNHIQADAGNFDEIRSKHKSLAAGVEAVTARLNSMELSAAKKAGYVGLVGALTVAFNAGWAALKGMWQ